MEDDNLLTLQRERYEQLTAQKELLEVEAEAITEELTTGENPPGLKGNLVDSEGFPRADVDIYNIRNKRNRLAIINSDFKVIMKEIELLLPQIYVSSNKQVEDFNEVADDGNLKHIAIIDEILADSPANTAGLSDGDKLISFGGVNSTYSNPLSAIPDVVKVNVNKIIPLVIRRSRDGKEEAININITPKVWNGRGLLGCHLTPIK